MGGAQMQPPTAIRPKHFGPMKWVGVGGQPGWGPGYPNIHTSK